MGEGWQWERMRGWGRRMREGNEEEWHIGKDNRNLKNVYSFSKSFFDLFYVIVN